MKEDLTALREQLAQLQSRHKSGALSDAQFKASRGPLEQRIVAAVMAGPNDAAPATSARASPPAAPRVPRRLWAGTAVFVLVLAAAGYAWKGSPGLAGVGAQGADDSDATAPDAAGSAAHTTGRPQIEAMAQRLAERLQERGEDPEGWSLLGRTQMALGRHAEAAQSYARALALRPNDATALADRADALAMAAGRRLEGEPTQLITRALKIDPDHLKALVLAGSAAFQRNDFAAAAAHWDHAARVGPADNPLVEMARSGADEARQRGKLPPAPTAGVTAPAAAVTPTTPAAAAQDSKAISGTVRLAAALKDKAAPGDMVFIFARPAAGGMPLALLQRQAKDLPAAFSLSDAQAMSPAARLSQAATVVVTARISKSGQAMPAAGDLEGQSVPVKPGARDVVVEISTVRQ